MMNWVNSVLRKIKKSVSGIGARVTYSGTVRSHFFLFENLVTEVTPTVVPLA